MKKTIEGWNTIMAMKDRWKYFFFYYTKSLPSRDAPFITRDEIANEMGISDTQRDNIIDELFDRGHVTKNGVIGTKIRITEKGREYTRDVILG